MSFIAVIFHFTEAYLNAEIFQDTRADTGHEHFCCTGTHLWKTKFYHSLKTSCMVGSSTMDCMGVRELCSENEEQFEKLKGPDSTLGRQQKVILLKCSLFLSCIFVEWTHSVLYCIQAVNCRVPVGNMSYTLDYNGSPSPPRRHEYTLAAGKRAS